MKLAFLLTLALVVLVNQAWSDDDYCENDGHCEIDECCTWNLIKTAKRCEDKPDDIGDRCGGDRMCGCDERKGLVCVDDSSFIGNFRRGTGSCQRQRSPGPY